MSRLYTPFRPDDWRRMANSTLDAHVPGGTRSRGRGSGPFPMEWLARPHPTEDENGTRPANGGKGSRPEPARRYFPVAVTRQIDSLPSSLTSSAPSFPTATPTGRPHTSPFGVTKPVRKSSYSPVA